MREDIVYLNISRAYFKEKAEALEKNIGHREAVSRRQHFHNCNRINTLKKELEEIRKDKESLFQKVLEYDNDRWISYAFQMKFIMDEIIKDSLPEDHREWVEPLVEDIQFPRTPFHYNDEWIGRFLKLRFILNEIKKIGALSDNADWVEPIVHQMGEPEVPRYILNRFLPSYNDAHIENDGDINEQTNRIEEWTNEASLIQLNENFVNILSENRSNAISILTQIQSLIRGFITRRRLYNIYGDNPIERIECAIKIQKIFRGFIQRSSRFQNMEHIFWYTRSEFAEKGGMIIGDVDQSDRRGIMIINTSSITITLNWIRKDGTYGRDIIIHPFTINPIGISTIVTHCFKVSAHDGRAPNDKFIRIPRTFKSGTIFDVSTGFSFTHEHWNIRKRMWGEVTFNGYSILD